VHVRLVGLVLLTVVAVGCSAPRGAVVTKSLASRPAIAARAKPIDLKNDHLLGVATVSMNDALKVGTVLDKHRIAYGKFEDVNSCGFVVAEANADRARKLIREDSWNRGYELLKRIDPSPSGLTKPGAMEKQRSLGTKDADLVTNAPVKNPETQVRGVAAAVSPSSKWAGKLVTVAAVATKDSKLVQECLRSKGIKVHGTWELGGVTGIVISDDEFLPVARSTIQEDARAKGYRLVSTTARESVAPTVREWSNPSISKDDLAAEASLIVTIRERDEPFVSGCLEGKGISSGSSFTQGSCEVYVSKLDADRALALIQEDARVRGYTYLTERIHYR
jgi:hypothetical protein